MARPGLRVGFSAAPKHGVAGIGRHFHFITRLCQWLPSCSLLPSAQQWPDYPPTASPTNSNPAFESAGYSHSHGHRGPERVVHVLRGARACSRPTPPAERLSCWLRTARAWSGEGFGLQGLGLVRAWGCKGLGRRGLGAARAGSQLQPEKVISNETTIGVAYMWQEHSVRRHYR